MRGMDTLLMLILRIAFTKKFLVYITIYYEKSLLTFLIRTKTVFLSKSKFKEIVENKSVN